MPAPSTGKPPLCLHCGHVPPSASTSPRAALLAAGPPRPFPKCHPSCWLDSGAGGERGQLWAPRARGRATPGTLTLLHGHSQAVREAERCTERAQMSPCRVRLCQQQGGRVPLLRDGREAGRGERCQPSSSSATRGGGGTASCKSKAGASLRAQGRQGYPRSEHRMCSAATGPPLSACWNSLLDNYWQVTSSEQHFCLCALAHIHLASASWKESCRAAETHPGKLPAAQQGGERQELLLIPTSPALPQQPGAGRVRDTLIKIENMQQVNSRLSFQVPPPRCCCKRSRCGSLTPGGAALCYFHLARW